MNLKSYKDLIVWQKAILLVVEIYKLTEKFPKQEIYGLVSQMRRAAVSVASNIAEGSMRMSPKEFRHFLLTSYASGAELETQLEIAKSLNFVQASDCTQAEQFLDEVMRMLNTLSYGLKTEKSKN